MDKSTKVHDTFLNAIKQVPRDMRTRVIYFHSQLQLNYNIQLTIYNTTLKNIIYMLMNCMLDLISGKCTGVYRIQQCFRSPVSKDGKFVYNTLEIEMLFSHFIKSATSLQRVHNSYIYCFFFVHGKLNPPHAPTKMKKITSYTGKESILSINSQYCS